MSQVISAFLEQYGKPSQLKAATNVSMGETRLLRNVTFSSPWATNTLNGDVEWRSGGCLGGLNPHPEIPKALQNRAKLNPIVKTVKNY